MKNLMKTTSVQNFAGFIRKFESMETNIPEVDISRDLQDLGKNVEQQNMRKIFEAEDTEKIREYFKKNGDKKSITVPDIGIVNINFTNKAVFFKIPNRDNFIPDVSSFDIILDTGEIGGAIFNKMARTTKDKMNMFRYMRHIAMYFLTEYVKKS